MSDTVETQSTDAEQSPIEVTQSEVGENDQLSSDASQEEGLPENIKEILSKNRQETKEAKQEAKRLKVELQEAEHLKAKLAEFEKSQMSDVERAQAEAREALERAEKAETERLRYQIAATHKIYDQDDIELFLTGTDEETLTRQAQRLAERNSAPNNPKPDLTQGASGKHTPPSNAEMFAQQLGDF